MATIAAATADAPGIDAAVFHRVDGTDGVSNDREFCAWDDRIDRWMQRQE